MKKTLVLGASTSAYRYSNMAIHRLAKKGIAVVLVGKQKGSVLGIPILQKWPEGEKIHTVTMYLSAANQVGYYQDILNTGVERIIFNPGSENAELAELAIRAGIEVEHACTLVMLAANQY